MTSLKTDYVNVDTLYSVVGGSGILEGIDGSRNKQWGDGFLAAEGGPPAGADRGRGRFGDGGEDATPLCPSLSFGHRLIGFLVCAGVGVLFGIFSWVTAFTKGGGTFAVIYTFSILFLVGSTLFLCGPLRQLRNMTHRTRLIAAVVFALMMILTFVFALAAKVAWLTIFTVLLQYLAMTWYSLSYIPFARDAVRSWLTCCKW